MLRLIGLLHNVNSVGVYALTHLLCGWLLDWYLDCVVWIYLCFVAFCVCCFVLGVLVFCFVGWLRVIVLLVALCLCELVV